MKIDPSNLYSGIVYDALRVMSLKDVDFLLSDKIRPIDIDSYCYGPAFTNRGRIIQRNENYEKIDAIRLEMYKVIKPGDIIVLQADDTYCAHAGDITCQIYSKLESGGFISDGIVRDSKQIRKNNYPCFCSSTNPIDALDYWGIVEYQKPISLPGLANNLRICPGDWVYGDVDAVMVIPKKLHKTFEKTVAKLLLREDKCRETVNSIEKPTQTYKAVKSLFKKEGRW